MSVCATMATWKLGKEVTAIQKLLLLALADRAGEDGECWPSIARIIADTNLNRKTIIENRQELIAGNFIAYTGEMKGKQRQIPVMRLTYIFPREGLGDLDSEEILTSTESGWGTSTESGTGTSTENGTLNLSVEPKRGTDQSIVVLTPFEQFWEAYPRHQDKKLAGQKWKTLKLDGLIDEILDRIKVTKLNDWKGKEMQFIPMPSTWLNKRRWEDEFVAEESKKKGDARELAQEEAAKVRQYNQDGAAYRNLARTVLQNEKGASHTGGLLAMLGVKKNDVVTP